MIPECTLSVATCLDRNILLDRGRSPRTLQGSSRQRWNIPLCFPNYKSTLLHTLADQLLLFRQTHHLHQRRTDRNPAPVAENFEQGSSCLSYKLSCQQGWRKSSLAGNLALRWTAKGSATHFGKQIRLLELGSRIPLCSPPLHWIPAHRTYPIVCTVSCCLGCRRSLLRTPGTPLVPRTLCRYHFDTR